jgi:hypothetical protein
MTARPELLLELQTAAQARLVGDGTLMGIITGVFDRAPEHQPYPYISYGVHTDGPWPVFGGKDGSQALFMLDIWSGDSGSPDECYAVLAEVRRLLVTTPSNPPLTLPHWGLTRLAYQFSTILYEAQYGIRHMPVRFLSQAQEV